MVNKVEFPDLAPSICFVCEQVDADFYIDTLRNNDTAALTLLTGRKYICSNCVSTFASFCGWSSPERNAAYENEIEALKVAVESLEPDAKKWRDVVAQIPIPGVETPADPVEVFDAPKPAAKRGRPRKVGAAS